MPNQQLLENLRDVLMPPAPQFWPPAIGWWLLLIAAVAAIGLAVWIVKVVMRRGEHKSIAVHLDEVLTLQPHAALRALSVVMRKIAITRFPRSQTAGLTGDDWLEFLDRSGNTDQFTQGAGRFLADAPYTRNSDIDIAAVHQVCRQWVLTVLKGSK